MRKIDDPDPHFDRSRSEPPAGNTDVMIHGTELRVLGRTDDALVLTYPKPPHVLFLMADDKGAPGLVTFAAWRAMVADGHARIIETPIWEDDRSAGLIAVCNRLDAAGVPNGHKAISIWLHRNWTADLSRRYGPAVNAHTIRRWRAKRRSPPPG